MMINPADIFKIKQGWDRFRENHPKFPLFARAVMQNGIEEDSVIEIAVVTPDGKRMETNMKVTASDLEFFEMIKGVATGEEA